MPSAKRKVVPQTGGLFGFFESKTTDPNAPAVPPATEGENKGWLSGLLGKSEPSNPEVKKPTTEPEAKSSWWSFWSKKEAPAAAPAPAQSGGKKRAAAKKTKAKTKAVKAKK